MKTIVTGFVALLACLLANAQNLPYNEPFESYPVNALIAQSNPVWWNTWSNAPGSGEDGPVVSTFSFSPSKSLMVRKEGTATTDLILKLGDKTSGVFELSWYMYLETAKCGYYNFQHYQIPGTELACEVYFKADGSGELFAGSLSPKTFTYPKNAWFLVHHFMDLNNNIIQLSVNGKVVKSWPLNYQPGTTTGTKKIGCIEFFATAKSGSGETPGYYVDNISYVQTGASTDPIIQVNPDTIKKTIPAGNFINESCIVNNQGLSMLDFSINVMYDLPQIKNINATIGSSNGISGHFHPTATQQVMVDRNDINLAEGSVILHYDSGFFSAVGWNPWPVTVTVAARFPNEKTLQFAGMAVDSVYVYINNLNSSGNNDMYLHVYGMGDANQPGTLLVQQKFVPVKNSWNKIKLNNPVKVTGEDLWIGYQFTQSEGNVYIPGCDAGPNNPNGDFFSTGAGWSHLSASPNMQYNWNIRAHLSGSTLPQWLSTNPAASVVAAGGSKKVDVTLNSTYLNNGNYFGRLRFISNDPVHPRLDVPVILYVITGIDESDKTSIAIFPNPANDLLFFRSSQTIESITIFDLSGKMLLFSEQSGYLSVKNLKPGLYIAAIRTPKGIHHARFIRQ